MLRPAAAGRFEDLAVHLLAISASTVLGYGSGFTC